MNTLHLYNGTIYLGEGVFSQIFDDPLAAKLLMGPEKVWGEMMAVARTTSITVQNLVEIERRTSA